MKPPLSGTAAAEDAAWQQFGRLPSDAQPQPGGPVLLLIERVSAALCKARHGAGWRSAGSRRGVFINELRVQLGHRHIAASGRNASGSSGDPGMFGMLLQSQVAVLGSYCAGAAVQDAPAAATVYDYA
jgi:hypothetical protein